LILDDALTDLTHYQLNPTTTHTACLLN